jgi:hypothetical protein
MFSKSDPRTHLQSRLDSENRRANQAGCNEDDGCTHCSSTSSSTTNNPTGDARRLFRSGSSDTASKRLVRTAPR